MGRGKGATLRASSKSALRHSPAIAASEEPPYGALDPVWLAKRITEHGPYAYHILRRSLLTTVLAEGLIPWDMRQGRRHNQLEEMAPRPGHVYIGLDGLALEEWGAEMLQTTEELAVVAIDLRQLDIRRIVADEDIFAVLGEDTSSWGIAACEFGKGKRYATSGEWAEAVRLGAQPNITEASAERTSRLAIRGIIAPAFIHEVV
jgi:hypothetical protein